MGDVWPVVHGERRALITLLESLEPHQWDAPSLCGGWTVHDVVAHLVDTAKTTRLGFLFGLAYARFDFDRQNAAGVARERGGTPLVTLARFRAVVDRTSTPPGSLDTRLVEAIVHGEDIRRPLAVTHDYPLTAVERALRLQVRTPQSFGGGKELAAGLTLRAGDGGVSVGTGPVVSGTALALLMVVSGRPAFLPELDGPGAPVLVRRVSGGTGS